MTPVAELINTEEPGIDIVRTLLAEGSKVYEILPPSPERADRLFETQVTTRSPMGAIVYESGGILIDHGWLRLLGASCDRFKRSLPEWNKEILGDDRSAYLVADDVLGGFFAINGGAFSDDLGKLYYLPYDDVNWTPIGLTYSEFIGWSVTDGLDEFYGGDRFDDWQTRTKSITPDQCYSFYPFLWTVEGSLESSACKPVSAVETFKLKSDLRSQLGEQAGDGKPDPVPSRLTLVDRIRKLFSTGR